MIQQSKEDHIKELFSRGILITPQAKEALTDDLLSHLMGLNTNFLVVDENYIKTFKETPARQPSGSTETKIQTNMNQVQVVISHEQESKKREIQDFVDYFNSRFKAIRKILQQRQELQSLVSISKISKRDERENITFVGMILDKQVSKNGNIILSVEDPTGMIKVVVNKSKPELFAFAEELVLDDIIGIVGVSGNNIVFANNLVLPDIPSNKEYKKSPDEAYMVVISDLHVGNKDFLRPEFEKFINWLNGEVGNEKQKEMALKVKYLFINGDLIEGVGIYPDQDKDLDILDVYDQYSNLAESLARLRKDITLIISPGNHDSLRISEPQPPLSKDYAKSIYSLPNTLMVSNPSIVNIHSSKDFPGFDVLIYHGFSFPFFANNVASIRSSGGMERADKIMKFLLQRRHLAPTHTSTMYIPEKNIDPLVIEKIPDFFITGHIHRVTAENYKSVTLINSSCWVPQTTYQEKQGLQPQPARAVIVNLKTRDIKIMKFGQD